MLGVGGMPVVPADSLLRWRLDDGTEVTARPICPEDAELEQEFVRRLSEETKRFRFLATVRELTPEMVRRFTCLDPERELALIALVTLDGREVEVAVARYAALPGGTDCEFAIVVADEWQGRRIAQRLLTELMRRARARGLRRIVGEVLADNARMLDLMRRLAFTIGPGAEPGVLAVSRAL